MNERKSNMLAATLARWGGGRPGCLANGCAWLQGAPRSSVVDGASPEIPLPRTGLNNRYPVGRLRGVRQIWSEWLLCSCFWASVRWGSAALEGISGKWCHRWLPAPRKKEPRQSATTTPRYGSYDFFSCLYFKKQFKVVNFFFMTAIIALVVVLALFQPEASRPLNTL